MRTSFSALGRPPVYTRLDPVKASINLSSFFSSKQSLIDKKTLIVHVDAPEELQLNSIKNVDLWKAFESVSGLGVRTFNKIVTERSLHGDFQGAPDFDRRVKGITFARLELLFERSNFKLAFSSSSDRTSSPPLRRPTSYIQPALIAQLRSSPKQRERNPKSDLVVVSSWNAGQMSRLSDQYEQKVEHLLRFVADADADILCLQEVCKGVAEDLCIRLSSKFETPWLTFKNQSKEKRAKNNGLATLYHQKKVRGRADFKHELNVLLSERFRRSPEVVLFGIKGNRNRIAVLVNVHLSQDDPREEICALALVVDKLRHCLEKEQASAVTLMVIGDFNMNSDSGAFSAMRDLNLVELVRPASKLEKPCNPYKKIHSATTVGGNWYDNIWISEESREKIKDVWCFEFGGRKQSLHQNGYQYATQRRMCSSDHLPLVAKVHV